MEVARSHGRLPLSCMIGLRKLGGKHPCYITGRGGCLLTCITSCYRGRGDIKKVPMLRNVTF